MPLIPADFWSLAAALYFSDRFHQTGPRKRCNVAYRSFGLQLGRHPEVTPESTLAAWTEAQPASMLHILTAG